MFLLGVHEVGLAMMRHAMESAVIKLANLRIFIWDMEKRAVLSSGTRLGRYAWILPCSDTFSDLFVIHSHLRLHQDLGLNITTSTGYVRHMYSLDSISSSENIHRLRPVERSMP